MRQSFGKHRKARRHLTRRNTSHSSRKGVKKLHTHCLIPRWPGAAGPRHHSCPRSLHTSQEGPGHPQHPHLAFPRLDDSNSLSSRFLQRRHTPAPPQSCSGLLRHPHGPRGPLLRYADHSHANMATNAVSSRRHTGFGDAVLNL